MKMLSLLVVLWVPLAQAHALENGTTRVTLRDGHLDVHAEWDVFQLVGRTPTEVAVMPEAEFEQTFEALRRRVESGTWLEVDGVAAPLVLRAFIEPIALRTLAVTLSAQGLEHGALVRADLESTGAWLQAKSVTVRSPAGAGPVVTTFVQPETHLAAPGQETRFTVLQARAPKTHAEAAVAVLGAFAVVSIALTLRERRRA
jgi:hypothetical protein